MADFRFCILSNTHNRRYNRLKAMSPTWYELYVVFYAGIGKAN